MKGPWALLFLCRLQRRAEAQASGAPVALGREWNQGERGRGRGRHGDMGGVALSMAVGARAEPALEPWVNLCATESPLVLRAHR